MLFQQMQKPVCILSTDFDEFQVELKQLETNLNSQSTEYFLGTEKYYSPAEKYYSPKEKDSISATIIIDKKQDLEMFFAFSSTFYKTGCYLKYYFTLETGAYIFKNGVIKSYCYSLASGVEFIFEFTEFENICEPCSA